MSQLLPRLKVESWPVGRLVPYERNARTHSAEQIAQIAASIAEFGFVNPVLVASDDGIIAGHGRLAAAKDLGMVEVPVIVLDHLDAEQRRAYVIADNQLALNAGWDADVLQQEVVSLGLGDFDLSLLGFDDEFLEGLLDPDGIDSGGSDGETEGLTDPDEAPEPPAEPVTKPGDVWLLGKHRVMCGDSTDVLAVERLMNGRKADMVFTDPPYGMNLDTDYTKMPETKAQSKKYRPVIGDDQAFDASALIAMFPDAQEQFWWGGDWYYETLPRNGSWIVWDKRSEASDGLTGNHFEMLWSQNKHRRYIICHLWSGFTARNKDTKRVHPAEKPVEVLSNVLENYSKPDWSIVDLFGGSGSTLIACEKTSRHCRMMELDPAYCDVIVNRWQDFTGKTATLEATGEPFPADTQVIE